MPTGSGSLDDTCWVTSLTSPRPMRPSGLILRSAWSCIPLTTLRSRKSSHSWLSDRSVALVDAKRAAQGTPLKKETTLACGARLVTTAPLVAPRKRVVLGRLPRCGKRRQRKL